MYSFQFRTTLTLDPADSTTYYFGTDGLQPTTNPLNHREVEQVRAGKIIASRLAVIHGVNGTAENVAINIHNITQTSDTLLVNGTWDASPSQHNMTGSIALAAADRWVISFDTPAWVTNPEQCVIEATIFMTDDAEESAMSSALISIASNTSDNLLQDSSISANSNAITNNDSDISSNQAQILTNDSNISANVISIASNTSDNLVQDSSISANLAAVLTNDSDISALVAEQLTQDSSVSANLAAILTNDSDISANLAAILTNDSDISANLAAILANDSDISSNQAQILTNDSDISANLLLVTEGDLTAEEAATLRSLTNMKRAPGTSTARS